MPGMRKVVDERDARACLSALARSGETLRRWARDNGIDGRSLRAWQINLSRTSTRTAASRASTQLVELVPMSMRAAPRRYVVRIAEFSVEVGDDFEAATLQRILEVVRSC